MSLTNLTSGLKSWSNFKLHCKMILHAKYLAKTDKYGGDGRTNIHSNATVVTMSCSAQAGLTKRKIFVQVIFLQTISTLLTDPFLILHNFMS